jgi:hypothetical protein
MTTNYYEVEEKWMVEGVLIEKSAEFKPLVCGSQQQGRAAQVSETFYSMLPPDNLAANT